MGAINYGTSDYITIGLEPYDYDDFENDHDLIEELQTEIGEYGGTIENAIYDYISTCYEDDYSNIEYILKKYDFHYFHVVIKSGYYEGFYLNIETNFDFYNWEDKAGALKEATQLKNMLIECCGIGLCEVWPGWCTSYKSYAESVKSIKDAVWQIKQDIKSIETWLQEQKKRKVNTTEQQRNNSHCISFPE